MKSADVPADRAATPSGPAGGGRLGLVEPTRTGLTGRCAQALDGHRPVTAGLVMLVSSWLVLSAVLVALGLSLSAWAFDGPLGQWDVDVSLWFEQQRNESINQLSAIGSGMADTLTIVAGTAVVAVALIVVGYRRDALIIILAPTIEVTSFLVATFVIDRDRPPVERLDTAPPTSSFPSGHVAAAVAFYGAAALVTANRVQSRLVRAVVTAVAVLVPLWVALSRLARGMHYVTDVAVGAVAGLVCVALAVVVVRTMITVEADATSRPAPQYRSVAVRTGATDPSGELTDGR